MDFVIALFIVCVGGCWLIARLIGSAIFGKDSDTKPTYIDKSVHYHLHDNRSVFLNDEKFKNLGK